MSGLFRFYVGHPPAPICQTDSQWRAPVPLHRTAQAGNTPEDEKAVSYGDYFSAVQDFLSADGMALPLRVVGQCLGGACQAPDAIGIHLAKHGALYHPARVTLAVGSHRLPLVVNVAISDIGRERIGAEVSHLEHLTTDFPEVYLPRIYGVGSGATPHRQILPMFAGQWMDGYHELHRTAGENADPERWLVWDNDSDDGAWCLSENQVDAFFRQAVFILTYYFDPRTLHAILEWHHAAGDFIVKGVPGGPIDVRLITVRRYIPLFDMPTEAVMAVHTVLDALAIFFLRTTLWMRLDRLEGVGPLVWAADRAMAPMWEGFVMGLEAMARMHRLPDVFVVGAVRYLAAHEQHDWERLGAQLLARYPSGLPEAGIIARHLERHITHLVSAIRSTNESSDTPSVRQQVR